MNRNLKIGREINLLERYPKASRNLKDRNDNKTEEDRLIARMFGKDFFDGDRRHGYGGFSYNSKFWSNVILDIYKFYELSDTSSILDVGCGKGFMLYDFHLHNKNLDLKGIDISSYAIENSQTVMKPHLSVSCASELPFDDNSFDLVISINTIHNLNEKKCAKALKEINRVSKKYSFITVDAYRDEIEKKRMFEWNLTAKTIFSVDELKDFFFQNNYQGDFFWFIP